MPSQGMPRLDLGGNWTPLVRNVILTLFVIYVAQLLAPATVEGLFAWQPFGAGFRPWQVLTAFFLGYDPIGSVLSWLTLYFFLPLLEGTLGLRRLAWATLFSWFFAVVATIAALALGIASVPFVGCGPILLAYSALFGFLMPETEFRLFFVLPLKAKWIGWGGGLLAFLFFLASHNTVTAVPFFAWVGAWVWAGSQGGAFRRMRLQAQRRKVERQISRLQVIEGGKPKPDSWVN
jgi:membrane associated rhomboid family serine protease